MIERFGAAGIPRENITCERDTFTFATPGTPAALVADFRAYYGPTMNAFAAAEEKGRTEDLQRELVELFERENRSKMQTSIPATFLRVTVTV